MATTPPGQKDSLRTNVLLAQKTVAARFVPYSSINAGPDLSEMFNHILIVHAFGVQWWYTHLATSKTPHCAHSVEDTIRIVRHKFPTLGAKEPRLYCTGKQNSPLCCI